MRPLLVALALAFLAVGGASAQTEPAVYYEWVYSGKTGGAVNGVSCSDWNKGVGVSGTTRGVRATVGLYTPCVGGYHTCLSFNCEFYLLTYTRNTAPKPVEISSLTGLPRMTSMIAEMDPAPVLEITRSAANFREIMAGIMRDSLIKGITLTLVILPLVVYMYKQVMKVLQREAQPEMAVSDAGSGDYVRQHDSGYDGHE